MSRSMLTDVVLRRGYAGPAKDTAAGVLREVCVSTRTSKCFTPEVTPARQYSHSDYPIRSPQPLYLPQARLRHTKGP